MKKLLFTALAVVTFSGGAMAETQEIKDKELLVESNDCYNQAADYVSNVFDPDGVKSDSENEAAYQGYYAACEGKKTPHMAEN